MRTPLRNSSIAIIFLATIALQIGICSKLSGQFFEPTTFIDRTQYLVTYDNYSGVCLAVADMNGDGKDDIIRFDSGNFLNIQYQNSPDRVFTSKNIRRVAIRSQWATAIADVDRNGYNDIVVGGVYDNVKIIRNMNGDDDYLASNITNSLAFLQGTNFVDIDNDGHIDIFACNDESDNLKFRNDGAGNFVNTPGLIDTKTKIISDNSGNYASIWTDHDNDGDLDLYISKCKTSATEPTDPLRINTLYENDGQNNFVEVGEQAGLAIGDQTWMTDFADIDNDGDMDAYVVNHYTRSKLMRNNGDGTYTDITVASGLLPTLSANSAVFAIQSMFRDFNNDGFVDLLISGSKHFIFYNNGDLTFSQDASSLGLEQIESVAIGDLNNDGFLDIYAGYAKFFTDPSDIPDKIFINEGNDNNYISILLKGITSNSNGIGARVEVYGNWGKQIREVRSGEGYGVMNSFTQHFGLGDADSIDKIVVRWPSGIIQEVENPQGNTFMVIEETAECTGQPCNDNDACTLNDIYDAQCNCIGTFQDSDGDGVCNVEDKCPGYNDNLDIDQDGIPNGCDACDGSLLGQSCNDGNPCTENEVYNVNCDCIGTIIDNDNDGICDAIDPCPNFDNNLIGLPCNDNNDCTVGETWRTSCDCGNGQYIDADADGFCVGDDPNDNDPCVPEGSNPGCNSVSQGCDLISFTGFEGGDLGLWEDGGSFARIITDTNFATTGENSFYMYGDAGVESSLISKPLPVAQYEEIRLTFNFFAYDVENGDTFIVEMAEDGINYVNLAVFETGVDYNNLDRKIVELIINGTVFTDNLRLRIRSIFPESTDYVMIDNIRIEVCGEITQMPCSLGAACNDNDPCTTGETYNASCDCTGGTYMDTDNDGLCDAEDSCPTLANSLIGLACNDGNTCTLGETYDVNCGCSGGVEVDNDNDGICLALDPNDNDACIPNAVGADCEIDVNNVANCQVVAETGFENGDFGLWQAGGDSARLLSSTIYAFSGIYSLYLQANDGIASSIFTQNFDFRNYSSLILDFNLLTNSLEVGDQLIIEVSTNGNYFTYATMTTGQEILNDMRYDVLLEISDISFTSTTSVRIRSLANSTSDFFILDNLKLEACSTNISQNCSIGGPCDDGNPCTVGTIFNFNCDCGGGTIQDSDNDGVCDGQDICPNFNNNLIGEACNDGDPCTIGEVWNTNCNCEGGTYIDADNDGYCAGYDSNDNDPCIPDNTVNLCNDALDCTDLYVTDFENQNLGIWIDGGKSAKLFGSSAYANSGYYSFYLQADDGLESSIYTQEIDLSQYSDIQIEFFFHAFSMEAGDEFYLEVGANGNYNIVKTYVAGRDFNTDDRLISILNFTDFVFATNTVIRIRSGSNANDDYVILDDLIIRSCTSSSGPTCVQGTPCNDNDVCTIGEVWDQNCNCNGGTTQDNDGDGYCHSLDSNDNDPCIPEANNSACINQGIGILTCTEILREDFEDNNTGDWNDGGEYARLLRSEQLAQSGNYLFYVQGNGGITSSLFSNQLILINTESVMLNFYLYPYDVEGTDKLHVEVATDGNNYTTYKTYTHGVDFQNLVGQNVELTIENIQFTAATRIRFRSECNSVSDFLLLDDIVLERCFRSIIDEDDLDSRERSLTLQPNIQEIRLYPNPAQNHITIAIPELRDINVNQVLHTLEIYDLIGSHVETTVLSSGVQNVDISMCPSNQMYIFSISSQNSQTGERTSENFRIFKN